MPKVDVLVLALASPILIGIYEKGTLVKTIQSDEKSSDCLPTIFTTLLDTFEIEHIIYANGPGSFMAIKMCYLFFKSLEIVKDISLLSASAFDFNKNSPIKAMGKLYFHNSGQGVVIAPLGDVAVCALQLPKQINKTKFSTDTAPNYVVPAV